MRKIIAIVAVLCFLTSSFSFAIDIPAPRVSGEARNLATALKTDGDILSDQERYDIARIEYALEMNLRLWERTGTLSMSTFITLIKEQKFQTTVYQPTDIHFFFQEPTLHPEKGIYVKSRVKDGENLRDYHVFFHLQHQDGKHPIEIYTDEEFNRTNAFESGFPQRKSEDVASIKRDVQHEEGMDAVLRYAHEYGLAKKPAKSKLNYAEKIKKFTEYLKLDIDVPDGLIPIEDKNFFVVNLTKLREMMEENLEMPSDELNEMFTTIIVDKKGDEHKTPYRAHSSNHAMHVFVEDDFFNFLIEPVEEGIEGVVVFEGGWETEEGELSQVMAYELGKMLGELPYYITGGEAVKGSAIKVKVHIKDGWTNAILDRYLEKKSGKSLTELKATVVDLRGRLNRDFAMGVVPNENLKAFVEQIRPHIVKIANQSGNKLDNPAYINSILRELSARFENYLKRIILYTAIKGNHPELDALYSVTLPTEIRSPESSTINIPYALNDVLFYEALRVIKVNTSFNDFSPGKIASFAGSRRQLPDLALYSEQVVEQTYSINQLNLLELVVRVQNTSYGDIITKGAIFRSLGDYIVEGERKPREPSSAELEALYNKQKAILTVALAKNLAKEVGKEIAPPAQDYTLFVSNDFVTNGEYKKDKGKYGGRFNLERITTDRVEDIVNNILGTVSTRNLNPENVIAQLPQVFSDPNYKDDLQKLMDAGIKFIIVNATGLKAEDKRAEYRDNIYSIMLLARKINKDTPRDSKLYRLLSFFIDSHLAYEGENRATVVDNYVQALMSNRIAFLIKNILSYKPAVKHELPNQEQVAATLLSA